jgi:hypothetical protein
MKRKNDHKSRPGRSSAAGGHPLSPRLQRRLELRIVHLSASGKPRDVDRSCVSAQPASRFGHILIDGVCHRSRQAGSGTF